MENSIYLKLNYHLKSFTVGVRVKFYSIPIMKENFRLLGKGGEGVMLLEGGELACWLASNYTEIRSQFKILDPQELCVHR